MATADGATSTSTMAATDAPGPTGESGTPLLEVRDLRVEFFTRRGVVKAVRDVSLTIERGQVMGLVGESGSGKSVTAQGIMGLTELPGRVTGGDVVWKGTSLLRGPRADEEMRRVRGNEIAMVFQDPMTSLNPLFTVGNQMREVTRRHLGYSKTQATERAVELLDLVGLSNPRERLDQHPNEFSGGMRQRVLIAMALSCEPELLIADEPTTALDVTIQAQILELLAELKDRLGLSVLLITHDLGVVAGMCDRVSVMYGGRIAEVGEADDVFADPAHPYSRGLLRSTPRLDERQARLVSIEGAPPDLVHPPVGCPYAPRCVSASNQCREELPELLPVSERRTVACWHPFAAG
jgi:oligopeptide/dipeptide ABC transporter ATP-binding protein